MVFTPARAPGTFVDLLTAQSGAAEGRHARVRRIALWAVPALVVLVAGFQRRWMSDDGHIYVRTVRQILAGNGPVFNPGERAEASTGTLWQWLLVLAGLPGLDIATAAMYGGLLLTAAGFALAALGGMRLYGTPRRCSRSAPSSSSRCRASGTSPPRARDGPRHLLARGRLAAPRRPARLPWTCLALGLGPLVRPDLGLVYRRLPRRAVARASGRPGAARSPDSRSRSRFRPRTRSSGPATTAT